MSESTGRPSTEKTANVKKSVRQRPLPPDVNARNLAIEKQRREAMNENFQSLARLVPAIDCRSKSSKASIVKETIRHLQQQREMCIAAANDLQALLAENRRLVGEVNAFRAQTGAGGGLLKPTVPTEAMSRLIDFKDRVKDESPRDLKDESPESAADSGNGLLANDQTAEVSAINQYPATVNLQQPRMPLRNDLLTAEGEMHHISAASAPHIYSFWNMSSPPAPDFGALQVSNPGLLTTTYETGLDIDVEKVQQDWSMEDMSVMYEEHAMSNLGSHLNSMGSAQLNVGLCGFAI